MVTGSHTPFDRNGINFYRVDGEISKADEAVIMTALGKVCKTPGQTCLRRSERGATI
jgi:phosphomannomutase